MPTATVQPNKLPVIVADGILDTMNVDDKIGTMGLGKVITDDDKIGTMELGIDIFDDDKIGTMEVGVVVVIIDDEDTTKRFALVVTKRVSLTVPSPQLL